MFFSFRLVQRMYKGITFQGFLQPLPKKDPCHLTSISLTKKWENQRHTKESKKQLSKSPCPCTIEKNMIKDFFFKMKERKKKTCICQIKPPPLDMIQS